ncbi:hypothetical protein TSAR_005993 [Trichomalopsis sarcophagae]|uniref:Uncharacterized protein n=1 Tax=Trichomalopsis sarcophagae TaxID=543379 RepID=A0A232F862_9HYME|nr:hypothetical protein TSAR_005993 [Trichomalopsis sarcophagae]
MAFPSQISLVICGVNFPSKMKNFVVLAFVASCLVVSGQSFALKESGTSPLTRIIETKKELISDAKGVIGDLKQSVVLKKQAAANSIKAAIKAKVGMVTSLKDAKIALLKGAASAKMARLAAIRATKEAFFRNFMESKKAHLSNAYAVVSDKTQRLLKYKMPIKEKATALLSSAVSKVQNEIAKKKEFIHSLKAPATITNNVIVAPVLQQQPYKLHTYVSDEAPIVGKVYVHEIPLRAVEKEEPPKAVQSVATATSSTYTYGTPAQSYGPPADSYGPPADSYGPPDSA